MRTLRLLLIALSCLGWSTTLPAKEQLERDAVEAAAQAWVKAYNARDLDAVRRLMTEDVVLIEAGAPPTSGKRAAEQLMSTAPAGAAAQVRGSSKEITVSGDVAWRIAAYNRIDLAAGTLEPGQSLEIWMRVLGQWKLHRQMSSGLRLPVNRPRHSPSEPVTNSPDQPVR